MTWDQAKRDLWEFLQNAFAAQSAANVTPGEPTQIQAGVDASVGTSITGALSNHVHDVETAAPSVDVALGGTTDEGSGSALMRADARLKLSGVGASPGDTLVWDGSAWVPGPGAAGASWTELEIDLGSTPVYDFTFTITDAAITSSSVKVVVSSSGKTATGRADGDWLFDSAVFSANPGTGSATVYALFYPGPVVGKRWIQYLVTT